MDLNIPGIGYTFSDVSLLEKALTHSSFANESKDKTIECNERLEFLGDSILNMLAAEYLFNNYKLFAEGDLTKIRASLVCETALFKIATDIELGRNLFLGHGEERSGGRQRPSVLADATEALLAAMYLDGGIVPCREFLLPYFKKGTENVLREHSTHDYKTAIQMLVQKNKQETIHYELTSESGPDHDKTFSVTLYLNSNPISTGNGKNKKEAEQNAAKLALELFGETEI